MKTAITLGLIVLFLVVSGLHGLMWLLHGITTSYKEMMNGQT